MVPLWQIQEADNVRLQPVHTRYRQIAEVVLVIQSNNSGGEQVICQAHHLAWQADECGWGQLTKGGGIHWPDNNTRYEDDTPPCNNHIIYII